MEKKIATNFTNWCCKYHPLEEDKMVAVIYGIEILLNTWLKCFVLVLLGILLGRFLEVCIALTCFITYRKNAGGIHMDSSIGCFFAMLFIVGVSVLLSERISSLPFSLVSVIMGSVLIITYLFVPCSAYKNPITNPKYIASKKKYSVLTVIGIFLLIVGISDIKIKVLLLVPTVLEAVSIVPIFHKQHKRRKETSYEKQ